MTAEEANKTQEEEDRVACEEFMNELDMSQDDAVALIHDGIYSLEELASSIGADCPFFIRNTPVFASGTGNIFETVELSLADYHLCLVKPDVAVSTPEAYSMVTPAAPAISLKEIIRRPVGEWKELMVNDFEKSVFPKHPVIAGIKETLYEMGAVYASMSGSGSSVFGLFKEATDLKGLFADCFVWEGQLP